MQWYASLCSVHSGWPAWLSPLGGPLMGPGSANHILGIICVCVFFLPPASVTIIQFTIAITAFILYKTKETKDLKKAYYAA